MPQATLRIGDICYITQSQYDQTVDYIQREKLALGVNNLILNHGYSRWIAELIVYELI
jgi:hypothetical protein